MVTVIIMKDCTGMHGHNVVGEILRQFIHHSCCVLMKDITIILLLISCTVIVNVIACGCTASTPSSYSHAVADASSEIDNPHHSLSSQHVDVDTNYELISVNSTPLPTSAHPINVTASANVAWSSPFDPTPTYFSGHTWCFALQITNDTTSNQPVEWSLDFVVNTTLALSTISIGLITNATSQFYQHVTLTPISGSPDLVSWRWRNLWSSCDFSGVTWIVQLTVYDSFNATTNVTSYLPFDYTFQPFLKSCYNEGYFDVIEFSSIVPTPSDRAVAIPNSSTTNIWNVYETTNATDALFSLQLNFPSGYAYVLFSIIPEGQLAQLLPVYHPPGSSFVQYNTGEYAMDALPSSEPCETYDTAVYRIGIYVDGFSGGLSYSDIAIVTYDYYCWLQVQAEMNSTNGNNHSNNSNNNDNSNSDDATHQMMIIVSVVCTIVFVILVGIAIFYMINRRLGSYHPDDYTQQV